MTVADHLAASADEALRLARLAELEILDTPQEAEFDTIVELANQLLGCPMALVSLIDEHRQWFKARCGLSGDGTPRDQAFCAHAIPHREVMVVEDATLDARFADNPFVTGPPHVRFYAGAPLRPSLDGCYGDIGAIGTLCVVDVKPRHFGEAERRTLRRLADIVEGLIRARAATAAAIRVSEELQEHARLLRRTNRQLAQAARMASIGSWRLDIASGHVEWSEQVYAIHGLLAGEEPSLETALAFYPPADRARLDACIARTSETCEPFEIECDFRTAKGVKRRVRSVGEAESIDGKAVAIVGVFQDITEQFLHEQAIHHTANTDSLTGLPNRKMFEERLAELPARGSAGDAPYAILLIDLDGFKPVNDTLGHQAGDEVLQTVADRLRGRHFAHAFAARLGGDEFVMLVTRPRDCADLRTMVQALLRELRHIVERGGMRLPITATVGAALCDDAADDPRETLRKADVALYAAKRAERGSGRIHGSTEKLGPWSLGAGLAA